MEENLKYCPVCKQTKSKIEFYKANHSKWDGLCFCCKDCYNYHMSLNKGKDRNYFRKLHIEVDPKYREYVYNLDKNSRKRCLEAQMLMGAKRRAKLKGLEFNLTKEDIIIPDKCPILEIPLFKGNKNCYYNSPTLDRIDNNKGYTKDNIQIISMKANSMKNAATFEELVKFADWIDRNIRRYSPNYRENESIELQDKEPVG